MLMATGFPEYLGFWTVKFPMVRGKREFLLVDVRFPSSSEPSVVVILCGLFGFNGTYV